MINFRRWLLWRSLFPLSGGGIGITWQISSFTVTPNELEVGGSTNVNLAWVMTNNPDSQSIDNGIGSLGVAVRNYNGFGPVSATTTFTISAVKDSVPYLRDVTINFKRKRYWFVSSDPDIGNTDFDFIDLVPGFQQEFATTRPSTKTFDCSGGKYFYYMFPASFGVVSPHLIFNSLPVVLDGANVRTINFTNESGDLASYIVLRSNNLLNSAEVTIAFQ